VVRHRDLARRRALDGQPHDLHAEVPEQEQRGGAHGAGVQRLIGGRPARGDRAGVERVDGGDQQPGEKAQVDDRRQRPLRVPALDVAAHREQAHETQHERGGGEEDGGAIRQGHAERGHARREPEQRDDQREREPVEAQRGVPLQLHIDEGRETDDRGQRQPRLHEALAVAQPAAAGTVGHRGQRARRHQGDRGGQRAMVEQERAGVRRTIVEQRDPAGDGEPQHDEAAEPQRPRVQAQPAPHDRQALHAPGDRQPVLGELHGEGEREERERDAAVDHQQVWPDARRLGGGVGEDEVIGGKDETGQRQRTGVCGIEHLARHDEGRDRRGQREQARPVPELLGARGQAA